MSEIFDPQEGIVTEAPVYVRDVSADKARAEAIIRGLKSPMFIEDLINLIQKTCALTNDEAYEIVVKIDSEIKGDEPVTPEA